MKNARIALVLIIALIVSSCNSSQDKLTIQTEEVTGNKLEPATSTPPIATATQQAEVIMKSDIPYVQDGFEEQVLDIYLPGIENGPFPTLFMIHQGRGSKEQLAPWGNFFANKGFVAVSINHRQWPEHSYPNHVEDSYCALAWLHENADQYNVDVENIFAIGHSAGATLAATLGVIDDPQPYLKNCPYPLPDKNWVRGVISLTGIFDYSTVVEESPALNSYVVELLGGTQEEIPEIWGEASPSTWLQGTEPPFLLIHGAADSVIPPSQSEAFADSLYLSGIDVELILIQGADHNQITGSDQSMKAVETFLNRVIGD